MILRAQGLRKAYGRLQAVDDVSLEIAAGEIFGLLGPNGAGKTTVIKMICTLTRADAGTVRINGHDIRSHALQARGALAVVPQENNLDGELSVVDNLRIYAALRRVSVAPNRIRQVIGEFGLEDKARVPVQKLSGGQKRRVMIARVMLAEPELILLDEPTLGLDPSIRREIWNIIMQIRQRGTAILLTTHYTDEAESLCDRVAIMSRGRIRHCGTPQELVAAAGSFVLETAAADGCRVFRLFGDRDAIAREIGMEPPSGQYTVRAARLEDVVAAVETGS